MLAAFSELFDSPVFRCKWSIPVMVGLAEGPLRFTDIARNLGISSKTLAKKLEILSLHGYVKFVDGGYSLTAKGVLVSEKMRPLTQHVDPKALAEVMKCKWSREILVLLLKRPRYSSEIVACLPGISWKVASERLRKLVLFGLVTRGVESSESPIRVRYELTPRGRLVASWLKTYIMVEATEPPRRWTQSYYTV